MPKPIELIEPLASGVEDARAARAEALLQAMEALAAGDFTVRLPEDDDGDFARQARAFNLVAERNGSVATEVARVCQIIGREGDLDARVELPATVGGWTSIGDQLNTLIEDLVRPTNEAVRVIAAVAVGDLDQKMELTIDGVPVQGEFAKVGESVNAMVDQLSSFASEVTRVAKEVGTDGKLGGQANVEGVSGTWRELTDNVNALAGDLASQVRNIAEVTTAVSQGDFDQEITVPAQGEMAELKNTVNTMVAQLRSFAGEVTRVGKEVGTEGKLGGQAEVKDVSGTWRDLTDMVNLLASNLTDQVRNIAEVTTAVANGDLDQKISVDARGEMLELKNTVNTMVDQLRSFSGEVTRVAREVGTEGRLGGQAEVEGVSGTWRELTNNVNQLASNLTDQVRNIAEVTTAVANGDLDQKITVDAQGETLALKNTVNTMVSQLRSFADEVTRVAREVGTEGKLGGQARVHGVSGTWADLTENVNYMAGNLTDQVRNIAEVTTAVAAGDLDQEITVQAQGEILELKNTVNTMVAQLRSFAGEVTRVAKEVGTEGKLGGQAEVEGASGTWKALTDNVNQLASNLTDQVRAIAEVSTAVTQGDLTREVTVKARGEVADMSDNINRMIVTLRETTDKNAQQDWLNSNLARFSSMMQGQRDLESFSQLIMSELTPLVDAHHGAFFVADEADSDRPPVRLIASYGYTERKELSSRFKPGEGLVGQSVLEKKAIVLTRAPADYVTIASGLGQGTPNSIIVIPVVFEDQVMAVIELASFERFTETQRTFLDQLTETVGVVLNTIVASTRTEQLLMQSQTLTQDLQSQSEELRVQQDGLKASNEELGAQAQSLKASEERLQAQQEQLRQSNEQLATKAAQLAGQNAETELKNSEIEKARADVELQARQLAVSSRYKSEFLANMSHELRTPLNSLLILAKLLRDNRDKNLTPKQVQYASTVYAAGQDLVALINDILDLSKVESGKMDIDVTAVEIGALTEHIEATFRPVADQKQLAFTVRVASDVPDVVATDDMRLRQILKNLLSNAFKFTDAGEVALDIFCAGGSAFEVPALKAASQVVAFRVSDSGVGIAPEKLLSIFEAFQQADGTTSRKYGGTGLGLSISREIARLLSGEVQVASAAGQGSRFTLFLPVEHPGDGEVTAVWAPAPALASPESPRPLAPSPSRPRPTAALPPADMADDRDDSRGSERTVLIIEDDAMFAGLMLSVAREQGFNGIVALRGDHGLQLARTLAPDAVMLDLQLPVITGMEVLEQLKGDPATRHMPVNVVSGLELRHAAMALGTVAYFDKPVDGEDLVRAFAGLTEFLDREALTLLVVEEEPEGEEAPLADLVNGEDVVVRAVSSREEAREVLAAEPVAGTVLHLGLPDRGGFGVLEDVKRSPELRDLPVLAYIDGEMAPEDELALRRYEASINLKDVRSPQRLLDEAAVVLHRGGGTGASAPRAVPRFSPAARPAPGSPAEPGPLHVLIVDDDARNVFALTAAMEGCGLEVVYADCGKDAITALHEHAEIGVVLMDIMMPGMDGYETTRAIRSEPRYAELPIIALTAKAMTGDRAKCLQAGASDYITKPMDADALIALIRRWTSTPATGLAPADA